MMSNFECVIANYFEFIALKYSQIYYKYFQFSKYIDLRYHGTENVVTVSKKDIAVLLNFGILQSPSAINMRQRSWLVCVTHCHGTFIIVLVLLSYELING